VPDPSLAPIRVLAPSTDGTAWTVTLDDLLVNRGDADTPEAAAVTAELVAASCAEVLSILGLPGRVNPTA
jgi:hypothetical protein